MTEMRQSPSYSESYPSQGEQSPRAKLHKLIDDLPEEKLVAAQRVIEQMQFDSRDRSQKSKGGK